MKKSYIGLILFCFFGLTMANAEARGLGEILDKSIENVVDDLFGEGPLPDGEFSVAKYQEDFDSSIAANSSARGYILRVVNFFLAFVGILATSMLIYGGFIYITTGADDGKEKAKNIILYAVIGILVILVSFALVNTLITQAPTGGQDLTTELNDSQSADMAEILDEEGEKEVVEVESTMVTATGDGIISFGDTDYLITTEGALSGVTFTLAGGPYSEILWDFGDGTRGSTNPITHKYGNERTYTVTVMGVTEEAILKGVKQFTVGGVRAKANISKLSPMVGERIQLNGNYSVTSVGKIDEYIWTCESLSGNDGCFVEQQGSIVEVAFSDSGNYKITLSVTATTGMTHEASATLGVVGSIPQAGFTYRSTNNAKKPGEYSFSAQMSRNRKGNSSGLKYVWSFDGDTKETLTSNMVYEFDSDGDKTVSLYVLETVNGMEFVSDTVEETITGVRTFGIDFSVPENPIYTGESYTLKAESQNADSFIWGLPPEAEVIAGSSASQEVTIQFETPGNYKIELKGVRGSATSSTVTRYIGVLQKTIESMTEEELGKVLETEGLSEAKTEEVLGALDEVKTEEEQEQILKEAGVDATIVTRLVEGTVLALIDVQYDSQKVLSGLEVIRGENGYPDITFTSMSYGTNGKIGAEASITETWSVNGTIIPGGTSDIPALLTDIKRYQIQLMVTDSENQNIRDIMMFTLSVKNKKPQVVSRASRVRIIALKKKRFGVII